MTKEKRKEIAIMREVVYYYGDSARMNRFDNQMANDFLSYLDKLASNIEEPFLHIEDVLLLLDVGMMSAATHHWNGESYETIAKKNELINKLFGFLMKCRNNKEINQGNNNQKEALQKAKADVYDYICYNRGYKFNRRKAEEFFHYLHNKYGGSNKPYLSVEDVVMIFDVMVESNREERDDESDEQITGKEKVWTDLYAFLNQFRNRTVCKDIYDIREMPQNKRDLNLEERRKAFDEIFAEIESNN